MPKDARAHCRLEDGEANLFDAVWSRSGKHLIVTVAPRGSWARAGQVELTPDQLTVLRQFLDDTIGQPDGDH
jgi:hypothetical protein